MLRVATILAGNLRALAMARRSKTGDAFSAPPETGAVSRACPSSLAAADFVFSNEAASDEAACAVPKRRGTPECRPRNLTQPEQFF
jgi:hypothetical protein